MLRSPSHRVGMLMIATAMVLQSPYALRAQEGGSSGTQSDASDHVYAAQERFVDAFVRTYGARSNSNPDGKPFRDWGEVDFVRLNTSELGIIRSIAIYEHYELLVGIQPTSFSRAEYVRIVLRELARRGEIMDYYDRRLNFGTDTVAVRRPPEAPPERQATVSEDPSFITARDAAIGILRNPRLGGIAIRPDIAAQTGIQPTAQGRPAGIGMQTDTTAYDLGYSMGAAPQNRATGSSPLTLLFDQGPDQIAYGYCAVVQDIFRQAGRTVDQREAFAAGFLQARHDSSSNFNPANGRLGVLGATCPANAPALDDTARLMLSLRSWTDMGHTFSASAQ